MPSLLIVGGGFTGLRLAQRVSRNRNWHVTLVDPQPDFLFTPRLVDALAYGKETPGLRASHIELARDRGYTFLPGKVASYDEQKREATIEHAGQSTIRPYDKLVFAQGAKTQFYGTPGAEHAFPLKTWADLEWLDQHLNKTVESAKQSSPSGLLTFCVVGGGASGVEIILALQKRLEVALKEQNRLAKLILVQAAPEILPGFLSKTVKDVHAFLIERGIEVMTGDAVASVTPHELRTKSGRTIETQTVVWAAGLQPNAIPSLAHEEPPSYVLTDAQLQVSKSIFAGGDCTSFKDRQLTVPKNAQTALKMADVLAKNILRGETTRRQAYHYHSLGVILWLESTGTIDLFGFSFQSKLIPPLRDLFYKMRFWQLTR